MAIRLLSSESIDGALTLTGNLTGTSATFAGTITNVGSITTKASGASNSIVAQWQATNASNCATFRTTDSGYIFRIHAQNSGTIYIQNDDGSNYLKIPDSGSNEVSGNTNFTGNVTIGNSGNINIPTAASGNANLHFDGTDFKITSNSSSANLKLETSSTTRLTINSTGNATFAGNVTVSGNAVNSDVKITSAALALLQLIDTGLSKTYNIELGRSSTAGDLTFRSTSGEKVRFTEAGNVGINTDDPQTKLHSNGGSSDSDILWSIMTNNTSNAATTGFGSGIKFKNALFSNAIEQNKWAGIAGVAETSYSNTMAMVFYTPSNVATSAPQERMRINASGNVGIGNTGPQYRLDVLGTSNQQDVLRLQSAWSVVGDYVGMGIGDGWIRNYVENSSKDYRAFAFAPRGTERMRIEAGGNVGIGQTSPSFKLDVNGTGYYSDLLRVDEPVYSYTDSGTKHYTHLATGSLYGSGNSAMIVTTNIPGHNQPGNANMFSFNLVGYSYAGYGMIDMTIGVYAGENNYYSASWTGTCQTNWINDIYVYTDTNGKVAFQFGAVTDGLFCEIAATNFVQGFGNVNEDYSKGWTITAAATLPTQSNPTSVPYKAILPDVYEDVTFHNNVGIGVTGPVAPLDVFGAAVQNGSTPGIKLSSSNTQQTVFAIGNTGTRQYELAVGGTTSSVPGAFYIYDNNAADFRITLATSGNVGIGTTSPTLKLDVASTNFGLPATSGTTPVGFQRWGYTDRTWGGNEILMGIINAGNYPGFIQCKAPTDYSVTRPFLINPQGGNVGIGTDSPQTTLHTGPTTTITNAFTARFAASNFFASGGNSMFYVPDTAANIMMFGSNQFGTNQIEFYHKNPGTSQSYVGRISTSGSATSYVTSSDYRLKENIVPISESISRLNQLKPSRFNFIEEPGKVVDGFIAHEVQDIVPEAIVGEKDEVDEEGGIIPQGIDQAKLVPLLVAAVQELEARVKELENK